MGVEDKAGLRDMLERCVGPLHAAAQRSAERLGVGASSSAGRASAVHSNGHSEQADAASSSALARRRGQTELPEGAGSSSSNAVSQDRQPGALVESGMQAYMAVARLQQAASIVEQLLQRGLAHVPDAELRERVRAFLEEP